MKANRFFEKILFNWPVKVCCLILAIALYLFHQASLTEKRSFVIPLTIVEEGLVQHTGDYTSTVTVVVRANTEEISSVHSNQLNAYVNLNNISKNGEYNLPVGKRDFNTKMQAKLDEFIDRIQSQDCNFTCQDFRDFDTSKLNQNDFVYVDPPYLITCASYNEQDGWTEKDEKDLAEAEALVRCSYH